MSQKLSQSITNYNLNLEIHKSIYYTKLLISIEILIDCTYFFPKVILKIRLLVLNYCSVAYVNQH